MKQLGPFERLGNRFERLGDGFELDFATLGKGVDADLVVAIEIDSFRLYDGQTMYKGRAKLSTTVC